jgi:hypothetical protein
MAGVSGQIKDFIFCIFFTSLTSFQLISIEIFARHPSMDSYPPFTDLPHVMQSPDIEQPYNAWDHSLPADNPFVARTAQFLLPFSPIGTKSPEPPYPQQPWWKAQSYPCSVENISSEAHSYGPRPSPWNVGTSSTPDPQSPRSSNSGSVPTIDYRASPRFQQDTSVVFNTDPSLYTMPENLIDIEPSLLLPGPRVFEVRSGRQSPFEELSRRPSSHPEHNSITETRCSPPLHQNSIALASLPRSRGTSTSRVRKSTEKRRGSAPGRRRRPVISGTSNEEEPRIFVCSFAPYGCESKFVSKNEWKRHVTSQHLRLGFYRCDVGKCNAQLHTPNSPLGSRSIKSHFTPILDQPNDFNRKDLFTQHQRRMHAPWVQVKTRHTPTERERAVFESSLEDVRRRCWQGLRQPPTWSHCGFCGETFSGNSSWDARMEHVGRHVEREEPARLGEEMEDVALREWGLNEGILAVFDGRCKLASLIGC